VRCGGRGAAIAEAIDANAALVTTALAPVAAPSSSLEVGCAYFPPDALTPASPTYADWVAAPPTTCSAIAGWPPCLCESLRVCACD
jgi:hypothetical protein